MLSGLVRLGVAVTIGEWRCGCWNGRAARGIGLRAGGGVAGAGSVVLLSGEAGIGKTSVVRAFLRAASGRARVLGGRL